MAEVHVYTIEPEIPFVDAIAAGTMRVYGMRPETLSSLRILLPTRRACRALTAAYLRASGGAPLLLPRLAPLGDLDEDEIALTGESYGFVAHDVSIPPAISPLRRQLLLTRLVLALRGASCNQSYDQAARLAQELGRLLDQVQTERLDFAGLRELVPAELAEHWQLTLDFLAIVTDYWPRILADEGCIDPAEHRTRVLAAQAAEWRRRPPEYPVVAAGSTGSIPATADLLTVIAGLPNGTVILPGLDRNADDETWAAILNDPGHPQYGMAQLLRHLNVDRRAVGTWAAAPMPIAASERSVFLQRMFKPAATFSGPVGVSEADTGALEGVIHIDCPTTEDEARLTALVMRETLETPGRTAALVTASRSLARRVAGELRRWGIEIDDSAGQPLGSTPPGVFLRLVAGMVAEGFAPVPLLAALKHPLAGLGLASSVYRASVRTLERLALRGPRPAPGLQGLSAALGTEDAAVSRLLTALDQATAPFVALMRRKTAPFAELITAHIAAAETLASADHRQVGQRLWADDAGESAIDFCEGLLAVADALGTMPPGDYPALFDVLIAEPVVRPQFGRHPRLAIWGPLEARLQRADVMILGGLNENTWPPKVDPSPWMSRPMMRAFGLPLPERKIGLSAHDFAQALCAPTVYLTRARREEGSPTVPSRWLQRLQLFAANSTWAARNARIARQLLNWQRQLDAPSAAERVVITPPAPRPPIAARPRQLSVTQIETWMRDPYAIYARAILNLKALDPIDADPGAAEYGIAVHRALDAFLRRCPGAFPADARLLLLNEGERAFGELLGRPGVRAFWWPRFERIVDWFLAVEQERRPVICTVASEASGCLVVDAPAGPFTLVAKADRIDRLADGSLAIIDYKTGTPPAQRDVAVGLAPQLPLEAAIAASGGFGEAARGAVSALAYWRLTGGRPAGEVKDVGDDPNNLVAAATDGLKRLIAAFDQPGTPYLAQPRPAAAPRYSDYAHLARIREWSAGGGDGA